MKSLKIIALALMAVIGSGAKAQHMTEAEVDSLSRAAATIMADQVTRSLANLEGTGVALDDAKFNETLLTGLTGGDTGFTLQTADQFIGRMIQRMSLEYARQQGQFIDSLAHVQGATMLPSGVVFIVETEGEGVKPTAADKVLVNYVGRLSNGTVFDDTKGEPVTFDVSGLVSGFTEGLQQMKPGGRYRIILPAATAYGEQGIPGVIPGNSALDFTVDLLQVIPPDPNQPVEEIATPAAE